jgi:gamma-butyrobetaine dioxygenase
MPFNWLQLKDDISILSVAQKQLRTKGVVFIRNAPVDINSIITVASVFGIIQETNYGKVFDVKAETQASNLAFTSAALSLHTDNPYRQPTPPGFQCLLCLQPATEGGVTVFADGFQAAKELERTNFESFNILTSTNVTFRYADKHSQLTSSRPVIELDSSFKTIKSLAVNNRSLAPLDPQHPELYKALGDFQKLLNDKKFGFSIKLEKGDFILWDNFRILHGRSSYELDANEDTQRHLQGCYLTRDSVLSNAAILIDR